ncbi:MAG: cache domain-containing protein [Gammaproteobacteria bacterium]
MGIFERHRIPQKAPLAGNIVTTHGKRRFLSLKWKALLLTSLVLMVITGAFAATSYINLINQFEQQRRATRGHNNQQIAALLQQSSRRQQQIGGILPLLTGMEASILTGDSKAIHEVLNQHGSMLQIDMGIDVIRLYDSHSRPTARWGTPDLGLNESGLAMERVRKVNAQERPETYLDCSRACMQYTLLPMLIEGKTVGVALLGVSLADVLLAFNQVSGTDIALLSNAQGLQQGANDAARNIAAWEMMVMASTSSQRVVPVLHALARTQPDIGKVADGSSVFFHNRYYEASLTPLPGFANAGNGFLVMVDDISSSLKDINGAIRQHLAMGVTGLLLSEALLLALLWTPMSHLRRTALTLPLLAQNAFDDVRGAIRKHMRGWTVDEIDVLDEIAISLSHQLEGLNLEVQKRSQMLAERMHELARERDFVTNLLETAQVVILTQNNRGEVISLNKYGEALTFYQKGELKGVRFADLISEATAPAVHAKLMDIAAGKETQFRHESVTLRKDRTTRDIIWLHSRLLGHSEADPVTLSVGLDITERKRAELALQKMHGQLEIRVHERTQQLTEANQLLINEISERKRVEQALAERAEALKQSEQSLRSQTEILQSVLDSMADGVIVADQSGELLLSNPAAQAMSGHDCARLGVNKENRPASLYLADEVTPYADDDLPVSRAIRAKKSMAPRLSCATRTKPAASG